MQRVTKVKLSYETSNPLGWIEICTWAIDQFGTPGEKYTWHPKDKHMEFHFVEEKDAIHLLLRWL